MDMNNFSYEKEWLKTTYGNQTLELSIFSILICFAVFGNILTLLVVHKSRRLLWSTNILVAHLAMAHLVLTGVSSSVYIYWKVSRRHLIISNKLYYFSNFSNSGTSVILLAYMALDRYYVIVYPLAVHMTREYTIKILTIAWLLTLAFSCPLFHFVKDRENFFGLFCSKNKTCLAWRTYLCIYFLVFIVSPLLFISVLNIKIFWTIYQRRDNEILPLNKIAPAKERLRKLGRGPVPATKQKSAKMLLVLNIYFALSWLPYFTYLFRMLHNDSTYTTFIAIVLMSLSNAGISPIVYWVMNGNFRRGAKHIFNFQLQTMYTIPSFSRKVHPQVSSLDFAYNGRNAPHLIEETHRI